MKKEIITRLHSNFGKILKVNSETGLEFWLARELQSLLGYSSWDNFKNVINKAKTACKNSGAEVKDHFLDTIKMVEVGSKAQREIDDIMLTRYACYLIAQNGDPSKEEIAFAQSYFAVQTRKQELVEKRISEIERLIARDKLRQSEKELSTIIYERLQDEKSFAIIRSQGDRALFGGLNTSQVKAKMKVPMKRPLADFLPTITIKAKDFANEITNFNIKREDLNTEYQITSEHVQNSAEVRKLLGKRNIKPEELPPTEDIKKVERKMVSDTKKLSSLPKKSKKKSN